MATTSSCNFNWGVNGKGTPEQPCSSSKSSQLLTSSNLSFSTVTSDIASLFVPIKPFCPLVSTKPRIQLLLWHQQRQTL
ncbi:hypothetical protein OIU85_003252 [Salix viminalis]|uniref:Uncharacterized protein n=1 Tax=Salix viminalis TaxID=40686 RepID=A0A9Q0T1E0_SALVM|nr:hypothetical protein OIU85_003252 [Salix viminalis]